MNKFKIFLPPTLCIFVLYFIQDYFLYYPLAFGLIIGFANWNSHKYKLFIGIILSVLSSYISFFIGYFSIGFIIEIVDSIYNYISEDAKGRIAFIIAPFIISPLILFLLYTFVFKIPKTRLTAFIIIFAFVLLISQSYFFYYIDSFSINSSNTKILNPYTMWQIIMALAIQLLVSQKIKKTI
tara:strand:+ start:671 stop:1216 length:546 start_codon:yes stop_codon:yes gene_type:complete